MFNLLFLYVILFPTYAIQSTILLTKSQVFFVVIFITKQFSAIDLWITKLNKMRCNNINDNTLTI